MPPQDLRKTPSFVQSLCHAQILIRGILNVCLWLKFSPSLTLNKIGRFSEGLFSFISKNQTVFGLK